MAETIEALSGFSYLRYDDNFPSVPVLAEDDLFLQVNSYEVYLPIPSEDETLNIFESSILRLLAASPQTAEEVAKMLCLDAELVRVIGAHLLAKGWIDSAFAITSDGRSVLGGGREAGEAEVHPYLLLMTRDTQTLLPCIFPASAAKRGTLEKPNVKLVSGSAGKQRELQGRVAFVKEGSRHPAQLAQETIRHFLEQWNRKQPYDQRILFDAASHIVSTYHGALFLHVKTALQDGNIGFWVATSGREPNEMEVRDALSLQSAGIDLHLKRKAQRAEDRRAAGAPEAARRGRYWQVEQALQGKNRRDETRDEARQSEGEDTIMVGRLVEALEWGLSYSLRQTPPPKQLLEAVRAQDALENQRMFQTFAWQIGFPRAEKYTWMFRNITATGIDSSLAPDGTPVLETLLPLAIATAARTAECRFLDAVATLPLKERHRPLAFFSRLIQYGRQVRHEAAWEPLYGDTANGLKQVVERFLQALLPGFERPEERTVIEGNASLALLNGELALRDALSNEVYNALPESLRLNLMKISPEKDVGSVPPKEAILSLCALMEHMLASWLQRQTPIEAGEKEVLFALVEPLGLPAGLRQVGTRYYVCACAHEKATLGGYLLAILRTLCPDGRLTDACRAVFDTGLPALVDELATARGHGNQVGMLMDGKTVQELCARTFEACKTLGGHAS